MKQMPEYVKPEQDNNVGKYLPSKEGLEDWKM